MFTQTRHRRISRALSDVSKCARLIRLCDRLINDHRGGASKTGAFRPTNDEIRAVIGLPPKAPFNRAQYIINLDRQTNIITVTDRLNSKLMWSKPRDEAMRIANGYKAQNFNGYGANSYNQANNPYLNQTPSIDPQLYSNELSNKSAVLTALNKMLIAVKTLAEIVAVLAAIKHGLSGMDKDAKEIISGTKKVMSDLWKFIWRMRKSKDQSDKVTVNK